MSTSDSEFEYSGHLVFNEVCRTSTPDENPGKFGRTVNDAETDLLDVLPQFSSGNPRSPGTGYERLLIRDYLEDSNLPKETKEFVRSLVSIRYKYEEYNEKEAYVNNEKKKVEVASVKDANVFWDRNEYMLFRGSENDASKAKSQAQTAAEDYNIHSITFSGDFLLWFFYCAHSDQDSDSDESLEYPELPGNLEISRLTDAEVSGSPDDFGGEATIHESDNIKKSPAILLGLLNGKDLSMLEGDLTMDFDSDDTESYSRATLRTEIKKKKIQIKASKAGLRNASQIEKLSLASQMGREIASLYDTWEDLDPKDKYVPPTFIVKLIRTCKEKDVNYTETPRELLRQQANKRDESIENYNLSL